MNLIKCCNSDRLFNIAANKIHCQIQLIQLIKYFLTDSICGVIVPRLFVYVLKSEEKKVIGDRIQLYFVYLQT